MNRFVLLSIAGCCMCTRLAAQDTFSIVAADSATREVGSAGASCVNLISAGYPYDFLGDLLPDTGAINTQASYLAGNQANAKARMRAGDDPQQIINWVNANDVTSDSTVRQYGIVRFIGANAVAKGYTGANCLTYKNHINGSVNGIAYSIQGNILLGPQIPDSMEARFIHSGGDIRCRLMAALQGAKVVGADTRCSTYSTSSLFAFIKVSLPGDAPGAPSFKLGVITDGSAHKEPIDSLQTLFTAAHTCAEAGIPQAVYKEGIAVIPNPATGYFTLQTSKRGPVAIRIYNMQGVLQASLSAEDGETTIPAENWPRGVYIIEVTGGDAHYMKRVLLR